MLVLVCILFLGCATGLYRPFRRLQDNVNTESLIRHVLANVTFANFQQCYDTTWITTADDYQSGRWRDNLPPALPVLLYPFCAELKSVGNIMGTYFNEVSCAMISGAHFGMNRKPYPPQLLKKHFQGDPVKFFEALPEVIVNDKPLDDHSVQVKLNQSCQCYHYCWSKDDAPWAKNIPWIQKSVRSSIDAYMQTVNISEGTQLNPATDNSTHPFNTYLPLIPDVTIHYRCGDNLRFDTVGYGLLPFHVCVNRFMYFYY